MPANKKKKKWAGSTNGGRGKVRAVKNIFEQNANRQTIDGRAQSMRIDQHRKHPEADVNLYTLTA